MSDRAIQSYCASDKKTRHPDNYQSLGMSHSSGASFNDASEEHNQLSSPLGHDTENYLLLGKVGKVSEFCGPLKGFRNVESRSASLTTTHSRNYSNSKLSLQGYPISYLSQASGRGFISNYDKETSDGQVLKSQLARNFRNSTNALCINRGDFSSVHPVTPLWDETSRSTASQYKPQGFILDEEGRSSVPFVICRQEKADPLCSMQAFRKNSRDTDLRILKQGYGDYQSDSTLLLSQENKDIFSTFRKPLTPLSRKGDGSFLMLDDVSPKHNRSQAFYQEQHQGIRNLSEIGLFPSWSTSSKLEIQQHSLQTRFRSGPDTKNMRTFTPVNSVIKASKGPQMISERTHSLPDGERVSACFCKESQLYEKSRVIDIKKKYCQLYGHSRQGAKLQLLDSSTDSGGIKSVQHPSAFLFVSKNELSEETEALDMDIKENHLSGAKSFSVKKVEKPYTSIHDFINLNARTYVKLPSTDASVSPKEVRSKLVIPVIPDLNVPLPEFPGADNLMGHLDPSTHRDQSLDKGSLHGVEPSTKTRGKRKMSDILNLGDNAGQEIINKSFGQIRKGRRTKSELTCAGKEVIVLDSDDDDADDGPALVIVGGSSSKELIEVEKKTTSDKNGMSPLPPGEWKTGEITPHSWLRSWPLHSPTVQQTAEKNPEQTVVCKPQSSYAAFEGIRKRDVPGAAAMAAITSVCNRQINIKKKDKGSYKGPEESSLRTCNK